jgi:hypothetical protein
MKTKLTLSILALAAANSFAGGITSPRISGDYLEVRSCDVYTGSCVANSEMGLSGREGMLVWSVKQGSWQGVALDGLKVIAIVKTDDTLGDVRYQPLRGKAILIVDAKADSRQEAALKDFARGMAGGLVADVVATKAASIDVTMGQCTSGSCATVKAGNLVEISTRCLGGKDHLCGNEENYYPPLTSVKDALTAYTEVAAFRGTGLNATWDITGKRSAYLGTFAQ